MICFMEINVPVRTEFIKLDSFLKLCGEVSSGSEAKAAIISKKVKVNDEICTSRGKKLHRSDKIEVNGKVHTVVSE